MSTIVIDHLARVEGHGASPWNWKATPSPTCASTCSKARACSEAWCADAATTRFRPSSRASARSARRRMP